MRTTKEDMIERFRLYGEIYCMLAEVFESDETMDYFQLTGFQIKEMLQNEEIDLMMEFEDKRGEMLEISFENEMMMVFFNCEEGYCIGWEIILYSTEIIRKIKKIIERYIKALKEAEE